MTNSKVYELINENNFKAILTNELYAIIDDELAKGDDMDCELIDELVLAIESLEQSENEKFGIIFPIIFSDASGFSKRVINKVNNRSRIMQLTAWAAIVALLLSGTNELLLRSENTTLVGEISKFVQNVGKFFTETLSKNDDESDTNLEVESTTLPAEPTTLPAEPTTVPEETTTTPNKSNNDKKSESTTSQNKEQTIEPTAPKRVLLTIVLITDNNFKTSYLWREKLDLTGLKVFGVYSDETMEQIPIENCEVTGFNSTIIGEQTVTVKHNGHTTTFKVNVTKTAPNTPVERTITDVECNAKDKQIIVPMGTENPAVTENVKYRYVYSDGTFSEWTNCADATLVSEYDPNLIDAEQVITYQAPNGMEFSITVVVYDNTVPEEKVVSRIEIYSVPEGLQHYATNYNRYYTYVDEPVNFNDFVLKVTYKDGTYDHKSYADSKINMYGTMATERPSSYTGYTITFAYGDVTVDFKYDVLIKPEITSYSVDDKRWALYYVGDAPAEYDASTLVTASMNDSNQQIYLDVEVKGYDPTKLGYIELEIYYEGEKLCDYIAGYIYGDTGYAVVSRPVFEGEALPSKLNYTPSITAYKCMGEGKFETYADIKYELDDNPVNDPSLIYESGADSELRAMGISSFKVRCTDQAVVEYRVKSNQKITTFGEHQVELCIYNVEPVYGKYNWVERWEIVGVAQDFSYTMTVKEQASYYKVDAPDNIKINIQDIYSEFYDKIHVYAVYEDGREEEIFDYKVTRYLPSREMTSARLDVYITYPNGRGGTWRLYAYSEGYEDSFFITVSDTRAKYDNYYAVGDTRPIIRVKFNSASQEQLFDHYTSSSYDDGSITFENWDTTTPGEKEATIIYHSPIGDMKATYKYIVIPEYQKACICTVEFNDGGAYDIRYGLVEGTYKVIHTDLVGRTYEITDYTVSYKNSYNYNQPIITYMNPDPDYYADSSNPKPEGRYPTMNIVGKLEGASGEMLENGDFKITVNCPYSDAVAGTVKYHIQYPAKKADSGYGTTYHNLKSEENEIIIPRDMLYINGTKVTFYVRSLIVDDETGTEYYHSGEITVRIPLE